MNSAVSLGAGGHLNGVDVTATTTRPPGEFGEHVAQRERAGLGVELVAALEEPGRRLRVQIGAERHDEDVGVEGAGVGLDPLRRSGSIARMVDCTNCTPGFTKSRYGWRTCSDRCPPEHDLQLGEPEHEVVGLVDEHDVDVGSEFLRESGGQLQPTETRTQHHDAHGENPSSGVRAGDRRQRALHSDKG